MESMCSIREILQWTVNASFASRKPGELIAILHESHRRVFEVTGDIRVFCEDLRIYPILRRLNERVIAIACSPRNSQPRYDAFNGRRASLLEQAKAALDNAIAVQLEGWIAMLSALQDGSISLPEGYGKDLEKIVSCLEHIENTMGE